MIFFISYFSDVSSILNIVEFWVTSVLLASESVINWPFKLGEVTWVKATWVFKQQIFEIVQNKRNFQTGNMFQHEEFFSTKIAKKAHNQLLPISQMDQLGSPKSKTSRIFWFQQIKYFRALLLRKFYSNQ